MKIYHGVILLLTAGLFVGCAAAAPKQHLAMIKVDDYRAGEPFEDVVIMITNQQYDLAADQLVQMKEKFELVDDRSNTAEAIFWLAFCRQKQGRVEQANVLYDQIKNDYPETSSARQSHNQQQLNSKPAPKQKTSSSTLDK